MLSEVGRDGCPRKRGTTAITFTFDAKGTVTPDGLVHTDITPVGVERAPFSRAIDGGRLSWK